MRCTRIQLAFDPESLYPDAIHTGLADMCCLRPRGAVAQLGERLVRNEEASGSIPLSSTILFNKISVLEVIRQR